MSDNPYLRIPKTPSQSAFEALMEENQLVQGIINMANDSKNSKALNRKEQLINSINKVVSYEDPKKQDTLRNLLIMTAFMENSLGANPSAYGRNYTLSPMSIDEPTFKDILGLKEGAYDYTPAQKRYQKRYEELGLPSDMQGLKNLLLQDDPDASIAVARQVYGTFDAPLPKNNPKDLFNYYYDLYNRGGAKTYGTREKDYRRFMEGYNLYIK
jgi:hypothetical protein